MQVSKKSRPRATLAKFAAMRRALLAGQERGRTIPLDIGNLSNGVFKRFGLATDDTSATIPSCCVCRVPPVGNSWIDGGTNEN